MVEHFLFKAPVRGVPDTPYFYEHIIRNVQEFRFVFMD